MPGWPLLAFWTPSIDSVRMVSMLRRSRSTCAGDSVVLMAAGYPRGPFGTVPRPMDAVRTPDERFAALPDFPFEPVYREWEGLRLAHLDVGSGPAVVLVPGGPPGAVFGGQVIPP